MIYNLMNYKFAAYKVKRHLFIHLTGFIFLFSNVGQVQAQEKRYSFEKGMMGSPFTLVFYATNDSLAQQAAEAAFQRVAELNTIMSDYLDGSEINRLSAQSGSGKWVRVSQPLFEILAISQDISVKTDGVYDASLGPVVQMWRRATRKGVYPSSREIRQALAKTGYKKIKMDASTQSVLLKQKGMRLDIGGLGKGYAAEEAIKVLKGYGIKSAMMDAGGKIVVTNPPPGSTGWKINISNGNDSLKTMELSNASVATSGPTYRYMEYKGVRYSHIVNPKTGIGLLFHVRTTVVSPDGTVADALATAFSVAGIKKSKKYLQNFPGSRVWLIEKQGDREASWSTLE
jgi:thiamine biosynthesis lipoprotein